MNKTWGSKPVSNESTPTKNKKENNMVEQATVSPTKITVPEPHEYYDV